MAPRHPRRPPVKPPPPPPFPPEFRLRDGQPQTSSPLPSPRPGCRRPPPHRPSPFYSITPPKPRHPPPTRNELFDTSKLEELFITDACSPSLTQSPSHKELIDTTKLEESSSSLPQPESHKELIGTTKLEESSSSLPQPESREELIDTTKLEESSSSLPQPAPHKELIDTTKLEESSSFLPQPELHKELIDTTKLEESSSSLPQPESCEVSDLLAMKLDKALLSSSFVSPLFPTGLFIKYFVRLDKKGFFQTYPDRGGPFRNLDEAQKAVNLHHAAQRKIMCSNGLSDEEKTVRNALYWFHDGTRKHSAEALDSCKAYRPTRELLNSLLDRYNEDNDLLGDKAYVLKEIVSQKSCFDGKDRIYRSYSHFNLTMETKGADDNDDLYFAEVTTIDTTLKPGDYELYVLTCLCVLKPGDNGQCHVCEDAIKHPRDDVYNHGRSVLRRWRGSDAFGFQLFEQLYAVHDEAWLKAEEARVRQLVKEEKEARRRRMVKTPPPSPECHSSPGPLAPVMTPPRRFGPRCLVERRDAPTSQLPPAPPVTIPPPPQGRLPSQQRLDAPVMTPVTIPLPGRPSPQRLDALSQVPATSQLPPAPPVTIPLPPQGSRLPSQRCLDAPSTQRGPDYHAPVPRFTTRSSSSGYVPPPRRGRWPTPPGGRASKDMNRW